MKFIYPAVFHREEDGTYTGYFPDLEDCAVRGETLEDAVDDAHDAAEAWLAVELEEDVPLPLISDHKDIPVREGDEIRNICITVRFYEGWDE